MQPGGPVAGPVRPLTPSEMEVALTARLDRDCAEMQADAVEQMYRWAVQQLAEARALAEVAGVAYRETPRWDVVSRFVAWDRKARADGRVRVAERRAWEALVAVGGPYAGRMRGVFLS